MTSPTDPDHDGSGGRCPVTRTWCDDAVCAEQLECQRVPPIIAPRLTPATEAARAKLAADLAAADDPTPFDGEALLEVIGEYLASDDTDRHLVAGALMFTAAQMARLVESKRSALAAIDELADRVAALEETRHDHGLTDEVAALAADLLESGPIAEMHVQLVGLVNTVDRLARRMARLDEHNLERILERIGRLETKTSAAGRLRPADLDTIATLEARVEALEAHAPGGLLASFLGGLEENRSPSSPPPVDNRG